MDSDTSNDRNARVAQREQKKRKFDEMCTGKLEQSFLEDVHLKEVIVAENHDDLDCVQMHSPRKETRDMFTQTPSRPIYSVEQFQSDPAAIHFYTGLENYAKFILALHSLGPAAYCLTYIYFQVQGISIENQFFMTLMKLRRYTTNFELSRFFGVSEATVKNIVYTWISFMAKQWREVNIWPSQSLVRYFAPSDFKLKFPTTRCIIDGT